MAIDVGNSFTKMGIDPSSTQSGRNTSTQAPYQSPHQPISNLQIFMIFASIVLVVILMALAGILYQLRKPGHVA